MATRDYEDEYKKFHSSKDAKKDRASRNTARRRAVREGLLRKGDGKDLHHKDGNPRNNSKRNLAITTPAYNRRKK